MRVSEQVGVAAMAVVSLRWSSRSASDREWLVARAQAAGYDHVPGRAGTAR